MEMVIVSVVCLGLGIGLTVVWMKIRARRAGTSPHDEHPKASFPAIVSPVKVVVASGDQEVMSMTMLDDSNPNMELLRNATRLPQDAVSGALKSLVEPLMQVAPSVVTAAATHSTQLMEVVINGQMLAATDGNGLRAIAKAGKGFEHARLYLCSIYPDSSKILEPRLEQIKKSIKEISSLEGRLSKSVKDDCALIDAKLTLDSTINERRSDVKSAAKAGKHALQNGLRRSEEIVLKLEAIRADRLAIKRLVIETKNGVPSAVYLCQE